MRKDDTSRARRSNGLLTAGLVISVVAAVGGVVWAVQAGTEDPTPGALEEVQVYSDEAAQHTDDPVNYDEPPPVGGPHQPAWEECGSYDEEIEAEKAVHSLEHGAVWIPTTPISAATTSIRSRVGSARTTPCSRPTPASQRRSWPPLGIPSCSSTGATTRDSTTSSLSTAREPRLPNRALPADRAGAFGGVRAGTGVTENLRRD